MCQYSLIADSACHAKTIKSLKQWHHDSARCLKLLAQVAYCRWAVFGNEFHNARFHALEIFSQQNHVRTDFDRFVSLDQESKNLLRMPIHLDLFPRGWIEWFRRERISNFHGNRLQIGR